MWISKKLGRIPDGGGHRKLGPAARKNGGYGNHGTGYAFVHHAVDDYSRLAYSELLAPMNAKTLQPVSGNAPKHFLLTPASL